MLRVLSGIAALAMFGAGAQALADEIHTVTVAGMAYQPARLAARVGDMVRFVNDDGVNHDVFVPTVGFAVDLGTQKPGEEKSLLLGKSGRFAVECVFPDTMTLAVEVQP